TNGVIATEKSVREAIDAAGGSLQSAYDGGNSIVLTDGATPIDIMATSGSGDLESLMTFSVSDATGSLNIGNGTGTNANFTPVFNATTTGTNPWSFRRNALNAPPFYFEFAGSENGGLAADFSAILTISNDGATRFNFSGAGNMTIYPTLSSAITIRPFNTSAGNTSNLEFVELAANGNNLVGFKAPDVIASDVIWTLPGADGTSGQILSTDGSGNLGWSSGSGATLQNAYNGGETINMDAGDIVINNIDGSAPYFSILQTDGKVGIGTASPGYEVDVRGPSTNFGGTLRLANSDVTHEMQIFPGHSADPNPYILVKAGDPLRFATDAAGFTETMRIEGGGNVGIGTTSPLSKFQIENTFGIFYDENQGQDIIAHNVYENGVGDFRYATTAGASIITMMPERVGFFTFPSGTADASLSGFSTRMNLTSDGLVINGDNLNTSSVLDINSTTKGILVPRLTTVQRDAIASPATGLMVYNSTTNGFNFFNGSIWTSFGGGVSDLQGAYDGGNTINLTSSDFSIRNSGGGLDYFNISETNGNIGIGTTTNGDAITVDKASDAVMNMISSNAALGTQVGLRLAMSTGAIGTVYRMFAEKNDATPGSTNADLIMRKEFSTGGGYLEFLKYDNATNGLVFNSGNTSATLYSNVLVNAGNLELNEGIVFNDDDNSNTIRLETPTDITGNYTLTLPPAVGSAGQLLSTDASGNLSWVSGGGSGWGLTGNSGTTAGTNFLGTTDTQPLEVKVDNTRVMRFEYDAGTAEPSPNIIGGHPSNSIGVGLAGVTISGGGYTNANIGSGNWATIGGGRDNQAGAASNGNYSTISGGASNLSTFQFSSVGGGRSNNASGRGATIPGGLFLSASSFGMTAVGTANETTVYTPNSWVDTEPIFVVGNGEVDASNNIISNSNAMTILKNGNVGIGSTTPAAALEVKSGAVTTVDASGQLINSMTTSGDNAGEFNVYGTNGLLNAALQNLGGSPNNGQLVLYNAAEQGQVILRSYSDGSGERGEVYFRGDNGNFNAFIGSMSTAVDNGQITLFNSAGAAKYIARADTDNAGKLILRGASGSSNVEMTIADGDSDKGKVLVADATGTERAYMKVNSTGVGEIFASSVGIGTTPTSASLDIVGNIKITDGTQAAGRVLTSDANGLASWQAASSSGWGLTGNSGTNASTNFIGTTDAVDLSIRVNNVPSGKIEINNLTANTFLGYSAGSSGTGEFNTGIGWNALTLNTGHSNTSIGSYSMLNNAGGSNNTAIGRDAMRANTSGGTNTAVGVVSLYRNTSGVNNTALGGIALNENTTGSENTAVGTQAMQMNTVGNGNTATGFYALLQNTASNNVAVGNRALESNTTGTGNTALGYFAGFTTTFANANVTGSDNTYIGYNTGPGSTTQLTNATAIGANARVTQSNSLILGNGVNVGIGTTTPSAKLDIQSTGNILINAEGNNGIGTWLNLYNNATGGRQYGLISSADGNGEGAGRFMFYDHTAGSSRMAINSAGDVGIGTTAPSQRLHVIGNILASGTITPSDIRYKKSIGPLDNVLQNISKLRGVSYYHKVADFPDLGLSEGMQIGVIAQEVEEIYPQLVVTDDKGYKAVEYSKLTPILLEAIKEQQKIIDSLMLSDFENKKKIEALESTVNSSKGSNEMEALQSQLDLMKSQIEKLTAILTAEASKGNE
ncbi:tail fiber domain-containing protein, partial [Fulvivirga sp.]|uniref:tail fiber domain-containing protein n=1 Tax=Fulvivirga sp. TaxID=1931237 RepID=UPI0032EE9B6F